MTTFKKIAWPDDLEKARQLQKELARKVIIAPLKKDVYFIGGADASYHKDKIIAVTCLFDIEMNLREEAYVWDEISFPYIPGLLSFREGPAIVKAINRLSIKPDLIIMDGHGICHPKRLGIASHIGVILNIPTIGVAKSILVGRYKKIPATKGSWSYIYVDNKPAGIALRTRENTRPVFVSPGHLVDFEDSRRIVLSCCRGFRIPEPIRRAHILSGTLKRRLYG